METAKMPHNWQTDQANLVFIHNYSATSKNEILSFACKWMELENIILSEVNQAHKAKTHVLPRMRTIDLKQMK
jgi:hypothetical protein